MSSSDRVQYKIMLPAGLKARLEHAAVDSRRSLSAEIIRRLETSVEEMPQVFDDPLENALFTLHRERDLAMAQLGDAQYRMAAIAEEIARIERAIYKRDEALSDATSEASTLADD